MQRIPSLDGLRAISISLVVLSHLIKWKHVSLGLLEGYGALGVHIFFVLSGYLITNLLLREHERTSTISLREFYVRRAFRIFPAAFVFLAIVTVLYWHDIRWYHLAAALFYVANMDVARPWIFGRSIRRAQRNGCPCRATSAATSTPCCTSCMRASSAWCCRTSDICPSTVRTRSSARTA